MARPLTHLTKEHAELYVHGLPLISSIYRQSKITECSPLFFIFHLNNDRPLRGILETALSPNNVIIFVILICLKKTVETMLLNMGELPILKQNRPYCLFTFDPMALFSCDIKTHIRGIRE